MSAAQRGERGIWAISIIVAFVVAGAAMFLVELPRRQELPKPRQGGGLGLQRLEGNQSLAEQVELHDPRKLFLPTGSSSQPASSARVTELEFGLELARSFPGKLAYAEDSAAVEFPARVPVLARPADAIGLGDPELPFWGMGRTDRVVSAPPARVAYIEVVAAATGERVSEVEGPIRDAKVPTASDWQPLEMLVVVDRIGLVAPPTISRTSTVDGVDNFFREYLDKGLHLGEKLRPGSYVVTIGR
jgi:hypothetical protein